MKYYINAEEIAEILKISKSKSYAIIRELNSELKQKGYFILAGKLSRKYFLEKFYCFAERN